MDRPIRAVIAFGLLGIFLPSAGVAQIIDPEVRRAVAEEGRPRVLVSLVRPPAVMTAASRRRAIREAQEGVLSLLSAADFQVTHRYTEVSGLAGTVTASGLERLAKSPDVLRVDLDLGGSGGLADSVPQIGADVVQDVFGYDGAGVTVGVIDSGFDSDHPDLAGSLVDERCFCFGGGSGCCPDGSISQEGPGSAEDDLGHGTHVTGIITSDGVFASRGVAPAAKIVAVKVIDSNNHFCCTADVVAGMDWILAQHPEVKVINMSLGTNLTYTGDCTNSGLGFFFGAAVNTLVANGVSVFVSSMNNGFSSAIAAPACVDNAFAVGAVTKSDVVASFSNASPMLDLLGPGVDIRAPYIIGNTEILSGTSMASPHAAGTAALLLEASPGLTPVAMLSALESTGVPILDSRNSMTFPRVDAAAALAVVPICGDGTVDAPEGCDDGNRNSGDGCDASCNVEGCFECSGSPSVCGPGLPRNDCRAADRALIQVVDDANPSRRRLLWKWIGGPATSHGDFGNPAFGDDYSLCVFDSTGGVPARSLKARIPFGETCPTRACWRRVGRSDDPNGYRYQDKDLTPDGVRKLRLKPGDVGKARISLLAKGSSLQLPGPFSPAEYFDQDAAVVVQLVGRAADPCWESTFGVAATVQNSSDRFKAVVQ